MQQPVLVSEPDGASPPSDLEGNGVELGQWPDAPADEVSLAALPGEPLARLRDRAERQLNTVRALVLGLLATAALAYAPELTRTLRLVNLSLLLPMLVWTVGQYLLWYRR